MYLEAEDLWLDEVERLSVNLDKTLSGLYTESLVSIPFLLVFRERISSHLALGNCGGSLLLAEALNALGCRGHVCDGRDSGFVVNRGRRCCDVEFLGIVVVWASLTIFALNRFAAKQKWVTWLPLSVYRDMGGNVTLRTGPRC